MESSVCEQTAMCGIVTSLKHFARQWLQADEAFCRICKHVYEQMRQFARQYLQAGEAFCQTEIASKLQCYQCHR
eukprot:1143719-Pelagomonas_calceolata.AAC.2